MLSIQTVRLQRKVSIRNSKLDFGKEGWSMSERLLATLGPLNEALD